ncbi:MAG: chemotaxis protein CheW [Alphaproteobacteria bacterium]|nr:chemotaxis protein CheW [Alphaproteobacteria bacterium]
MSISSHSYSQDRGQSKDYVTVFINDQLFGIPVLQVQDIVRTQSITHIPLAPPEIAGSLNLRGRIVTAIDVRQRLGLPSDVKQRKKLMNIVIETKGELYSLLVDKLGEVLSLPDDKYEKNPATLEECWREISAGIYRLDGSLLIVMNVNALLDFSKKLVA